MPSATAAIAALLFYAMQMGALGEPRTGVGAFYHEADMRSVCELRVEEQWNPGLDCDWPCLAAWGRYRPDMLGRFVLADLPGGGFRICEIVDVRQKIHEAENGHIIIEIDGETATECGWQSYVPDVRVWRLEYNEQSSSLVLIQRLGL